MLKIFYMDKISILDHLEKIGHFKAVANHGSFLAAARSLGQSQPTLLYSVNALEAVVGTPLFIRSRNGARLTASGQRFLEFATNISQLTKELERELKGPNHPANKYIIATHTPYLPSILLPNMKALAKALKASALGLKSSLSRSQLIHWVECAAVDAAFVAEGPIPKTLRQAPVLSDHYEFYASRDFIKAHLGKRELGPKNADLPFVYLPNSIAGPRQILEDALAELKLTERSAVEVDSFEAVAAAAEMSLGIGILPKATGLARTFHLSVVKTDFQLRGLGKFKIMMCYKDPTFERYLPEVRALLA